MQFILLIAGIIVLVIAYFSFGAVAKFFLGWWILVIAIPALLIVGIALSWIGAIIAIFGILYAIKINNKWHASELYLSLEKRIDKAFYFSDV